MARKSVIKVELDIADEGVVTGVTVSNDCSTRDLLLAAMYLLEDAFTGNKEPEEGKERNPIAQFVGDSFNATVFFSALQDKMLAKEEKDAE